MASRSSHYSSFHLSQQPRLTNRVIFQSITLYRVRLDRDRNPSPNRLLYTRRAACMRGRMTVIATVDCRRTLESQGEIGSKASVCTASSGLVVRLAGQYSRATRWALIRSDVTNRVISFELFYVRVSTMTAIGPQITVHTDRMHTGSQRPVFRGRHPSKY